MPRDLPRDLGDAIRSARIDAGYTQESFAAHIELDRSHYGSIERGEHNISVDTLAIIAEGLKTEAWRLLRKAGI